MRITSIFVLIFLFLVACDNPYAMPKDIKTEGESRLRYVETYKVSNGYSIQLICIENAEGVGYEFLTRIQGGFVKLGVCRQEQEEG